LKELNVKSLLNKNKKRDDWFLGKYTLNPYAGCSIACIYCYTQGSKYGGDYGSDVVAKSNAVPILKKQMKNAIKRDERDIIILGSASDPYPRVEKELKLTREILLLTKRFKFPLHILTKSDMILRDMDILSQINEGAILPTELRGKIDSGIIVSFSFSTINSELGKIVEPGAASPTDRLETMKKFSDAGFNTGIINMPVLPFITDSRKNLEEMVLKAKNYGARYLLFSGLTLYGDGPNDCRILYNKFLNKHYPELVLKYEKLFGGSPYPSKQYQADLNKKFREISNMHGIKNSIL
jgi:DNA repair photolyase